MKKTIALAAALVLAGCATTSPSLKVVDTSEWHAGAEGPDYRDMAVLWGKPAPPGALSASSGCGPSGCVESCSARPERMREALGLVPGKPSAQPGSFGQIDASGCEVFLLNASKCDAYARDWKRATGGGGPMATARLLYATPAPWGYQNCLAMYEPDAILAAVDWENGESPPLDLSTCEDVGDRDVCHEPVWRPNWCAGWDRSQTGLTWLGEAYVASGVGSGWAGDLLHMDWLYHSQHPLDPDHPSGAPFSELELEHFENAACLALGCTARSTFCPRPYANVGENLTARILQVMPR